MTAKDLTKIVQSVKNINDGLGQEGDYHLLMRYENEFRERRHRYKFQRPEKSYNHRRLIKCLNEYGLI